MRLCKDFLGRHFSNGMKKMEGTRFHGEIILEKTKRLSSIEYGFLKYFSNKLKLQELSNTFRKLWKDFQPSSPLQVQTTRRFFHTIRALDTTHEPEIFSKLQKLFGKFTMENFQKIKNFS